TGFGQADTARRADEERCTDARLKRTYRRRRYPEPSGRAAEIAVMGDAQERLHAVERTLPDCEVLLHSSSTLSRIVARGKQPYIRLANRAASGPGLGKWLPLTLMMILKGALVMNNQSHAQTQTSTSTTTGVLALLTAKPGVKREQVMAV